MLEYFKNHGNAKSRSVSPENFTGEKGKGGMATEGSGASCARELGQGWKVSPSVRIPAGTTFTMADIQGSGIINHIWLTYSRTDDINVHRMMILRMYWDGCDEPAVECPVGDFFASAQSEYFHISSDLVAVNPRSGFNSYFKMPYKSGYRITMENTFTEDLMLYYQIDYTECEHTDEVLYFHSQFRRTNPIKYMENFTILDNIEGHGTYIGTSMVWGVNNNGWWGEGEIKFYLDGDKEFPTICGTGTEDYFCGSYNFDVHGKYESFSSLYSGLFVWGTDGTYRANRRFTMYRWHTPDPIFFDENIKVTIQALGWRMNGRYLPLQDDLSAVAYFYLDTPACKRPELPDRNGLEII